MGSPREGFREGKPLPERGLREPFHNSARLMAQGPPDICKAPHKGIGLRANPLTLGLWSVYSLYSLYSLHSLYGLYSLRLAYIAYIASIAYIAYKVYSLYKLSS